MAGLSRTKRAVVGLASVGAVGAAAVLLASTSGAARSGPVTVTTGGGVVERVRTATGVDR